MGKFSRDRRWYRYGTRQSSILDAINELWETREDSQFEPELGDGMRWNFLIVIPSFYIPHTYYALIHMYNIRMYMNALIRRIRKTFNKYIYI